MTDRLQRYRAYMARFPIAASPLRAIDEDLYVPPPGRSTASDLLLRLKLEPASTHLVVGGAGSGKSTELLVAARKLNALTDTRARYVDVSARHDLQQMREGILLILAGLELSELVASRKRKEVAQARASFRKWADGYGQWEWADDRAPYDEYDGDDWVHEEQVFVEYPGLLSPPLPPFNETTETYLRALGVLRSALPRETPHIVLLLDSLDRLSDTARFRAIVEQDARALARAGIGLVLVGPSTVLYGPERAITSVFDHFYHQSSVDVAPGQAGRDFLVRVLRKRAEEDILPTPVCEAIAAWSGGVMRDLLALARRAGEEAYLQGADAISIEHVERAADGFGRTMMLGLRDNEIAVLQHLRKTGKFVPTSDELIALLETRRVLEYTGASARFAVHPTIAPLLASLASAA